ncbi:MAG: DnaB-like helicase C-terminal domain-containing protein [Candidatus Marinimicrobia bacterium]|nr:DnaB-like helicase C-terminal domain-containing protein [Candidatus Neomarinimicrobiota bacterium]
MNDIPDESLSTDIIPPQDIGVERTVLGAMIVDPACAAMTIELLDDDCFYMSSNRIIFQTTKELFLKNIPIDLTMLSNRLKSKNQIDFIGGDCYLAEIAESICTFRNVEYYCGILLDKKERRKGIETAEQMKNSFFNDNETKASDISSRAISSILDNQRKSVTQINRLSTIIPHELDRARRIIDGEVSADIVTHYPSIDSTVFIQNGDNLIFGGRPSQGKTSVVDCIVRRMAENGKRVFKINIESSDRNECRRSLFSSAKINLHHFNSRFISKGTYQALEKTAEQLSTLEIYLINSPYITISKIYSMVHRLNHEVGKIDLLVIDYLQLITAEKKFESRRIEVGEHSKALKAIGQEFNFPTFILSQLARPREAGPVKDPTLSDLHESGNIEQNADVVFLLHRPEAYMSRERAVKEGCINQLKLIIAKNKNGPIGYKDMVYLKEFMRMEEPYVENGLQTDCWQDRI